MSKREIKIQPWNDFAEWVLAHSATRKRSIKSKLNKVVNNIQDAVDN
eukprot:gene2910-3627_t